MSTDHPSPRKRILRLVLAVFLCTVCASAQFGRPRAGSPVKIDNFTYSGQSYQIVVLNGQPMQVKLNNQTLLMINNGVVMGYPGLDASLIEGAKGALKAYEAANGIVPPGTPPATTSAAPTPTASQSAAPNAASSLTVDGVISLIDAGISADLIIAKIQKSGQTFDLSTEDMVRLKKAGASDGVIKTMMSATPAPAAVSVAPIAGPNAAVAPSVDAAPNPVAENPNMGKLKKEGFMTTIGHGVSNALNGKSVIDRLSMRNILPQWDPNQKLSTQYPHIAITVLSAPMGWMDDYRVVLRKNNQNKLVHSCFKLKAVVWLDAARSKTTDEFEWCIEEDMFMSELQPTYLYSLAATRADYGQTTGVNRTDGPQPPDKLLPNDRATLDMEAKTNSQGASKDLNLDENSLFAIMFANVRKDLGETLGSDGDYRVWITTIKKAAGPTLF
jgi:hypothetical protein